MPNTNYHSSNQRVDESDTSNPDIFLKKFSVCSTLYQKTNNKNANTSQNNTSTIKKRPFTFIENENNQQISSSVSSSNNESDIIRSKPPKYINHTKSLKTLAAHTNTNNTSNATSKIVASDEESVSTLRQGTQSVAIEPESSINGDWAKEKKIDHIAAEKMRAINSARHSLQKIATLNNNKTKRITKLAQGSLNPICESENVEKTSRLEMYIQSLCIRFNYFVVAPDGLRFYLWLIFLNIFVVYNMWIIIVRQSFENFQIFYAHYWQIIDGISDCVYLLDILVQIRTGYLEQGLLVYDSKKLAKNYLKSQSFLLDLFSILPLELAQFYFGYPVPMLRFNRYFKTYRFFLLYQLTESRTMFPNVVRVTNLTHILLLLGHWFAGFYFMLSKAEGFKGHWSYPEPVDEFALLPRMYLRCLYWSTLTLTTIGDLPPPETNWQYMFSIFVHYLAVFVIALIVGQVGNVITNRNASRAEFERLLDGAKQYMRNHNIPQSMQKRVQRWYDYSWSRGRMNGSGDIHSIGLLPEKLKTELALHVNLETLRKVTIFQECQPEFLHDLVLKMRAYIFTPGDMICRKGEVAREMFIIADGVLEVIGDSGQVFTKMYSGDFFGEIGILSIEGATNKRTADVRSVGYAELFSLSKEDVLSAVRDYPEAEGILIEYGKRRLNQNSQKSKMAAGDTDSRSSETRVPSSALERRSSQPLVARSTLDIEKLVNRSMRTHRTDMLGFPRSSVYVPSTYPDAELDNLLKIKDLQNLKTQIKDVLSQLEHPKTMDLDSIKQQLQNVLEGECDEDEYDC